MKKLTLKLVAVCVLLAGGLFYASAQTAGGARPTPTPKPTARKVGCCNKNSQSGGLTGCIPTMSNGTCPSSMVKANCEVQRDGVYTNCSEIPQKPQR